MQDLYKKVIINDFLRFNMDHILYSICSSLQSKCLGGNNNTLLYIIGFTFSSLFKISRTCGLFVPRPKLINHYHRFKNQKKYSGFLLSSSLPSKILINACMPFSLKPVSSRLVFLKWIGPKN